MNSKERTELEIRIWNLERSLAPTIIKDVVEELKELDYYLGDIPYDFLKQFYYQRLIDSQNERYRG